MLLTFVVGGIGCFVGIFTMQQEPPTLSIEGFLAVTWKGVLSSIRHAIYNGSDAVNGGWDHERPNNFQIELDLADLASVSSLSRTRCFDQTQVGNHMRSRQAS